MATVSHARGFDETEFNAVLENCLRDFLQVKVLRKEQIALERGANSSRKRETTMISFERRGSVKHSYQ